jgi:hypothetical protein
MDKYVQQSGKYDCGPTAVFNALIKLDFFTADEYKVTLPLLRKLCVTNTRGKTEDCGSPLIAIEATLEYFSVLVGFKVKRKVFRDGRSMPKNGDCALLVDSDHIFFIDTTNNGYLAVNATGRDGSKTLSLTKAEMSVILKMSRDYGNPMTGFLITKP